MLFGVPSRGSEILMDMNKIYSSEMSLLSCYAAFGDRNKPGSKIDHREANRCKTIDNSSFQHPKG